MKHRIILLVLALVAVVILTMLQAPVASKGIETTPDSLRSSESERSATVQQVEAAEIPPVVRRPLNIDALARAVSMQETGNCEAPYALTIRANNNCYSIKQNGKMRYFETKEQGTLHFKSMWMHGKNYHGQFPDIDMAIKYSSPEAAKEWLENVTKLYDIYNAQ